MIAKNVMKSPVITIKPNDSVAEVAKLLINQKISAAPVVDDEGRLRGIVSEGDLMRRHETSTERKRSFWWFLFSGDSALAREYVKSHGLKVHEIMTSDVITASPGDSLREVADLFERHSIKRVPIVDNGSIVGIVSRADLLRVFADRPQLLDINVDDSIVRDKIVSHLEQQPWAHTKLLNVSVRNGVVELSGMVDSDAERKAFCVAAESTPGVRAVTDRMINRPAGAEA